jgi:hypothetical protein
MAIITGSMRVRLTFPTEWDTTLANYISEPEFNAILTELGRLAAADSNLEQELFDALSYLIDKNDYGKAVRLVNAQLSNKFDGRKEFLRVLHNAKVQDQIKQDELDDILKNAKIWHDRRNEYVHARWCIPNKASGVVRLKFDDKEERDQVVSVKPSDLHEIATRIEDYTSGLRTHFLGTFGDYLGWLKKRLPPSGTPATPISVGTTSRPRRKKKKK